MDEERRCIIIKVSITGVVLLAMFAIVLGAFVVCGFGCSHDCRGFK